MNEKHLGKTEMGANGGSIKPEDGQHLGQSRKGENQVDKGEHCKKIKHGLVEAAFCPDEKKQDTISSHSQKEHEAKGKRYPDVSCTQSWDASQKERMWE